VLRGFDKIMLQPGQSETVTFDLTRRDISYWDIFNQQWTIGSPAIGVMAGFSSRDIQSTTSFTPLSSASSGLGGESGGNGTQACYPGPWSWWQNTNHYASHW